MVIIKKRKKGNVEFFYLVHNLKERGKVKTKEKYLGKIIPKNIDQLKKEFLNEIYKDRWFNKLDMIKKNFNSEFQKLPKSIKEKEIERFMIKFTYNTNRIEGSSLSMKDTKNLLHDKISPANKPINDIKETENHKKVFYRMLEYGEELNLRTVLDWHSSMFKDTKADIAGKIRTYGVFVAGSKAKFPLAIELNKILRDFFNWYNKSKNKLHPVELAALAHFKFESMHPFGDGNGRVGRLIMNFILKKYGYPMLDITYKDRISYYNALERANLNKQEYIFVRYLIRRYLKRFSKYCKSDS